MSASNLVESTKEISIPMAGLGVGSGNTILRTFVGSCVAICIYDEAKKIGAMAHVMLPKNNVGKSTKGTRQEGKFADEAIDIMIEKLNNISPDLKLQAKIAGGAKIFAHESESGTLNIGNKNIIGIRLILQEKKIPLVSQSVGAKSGRWVTFHCGSQRVIVKEKEGEKII